MFDQRVDRIKFRLPRNYKSDGNIQLGITFYDDNGNPFFSDLFDNHVYASPELKEIVSNPLDGVWAFSIDGESFIKNGNTIPTFNNDYVSSKGVPVKETIIVKYTLSTDLFNALKDFRQVSFKIHMIDGALNLHSQRFESVTNPDNTWS